MSVNPLVAGLWSNSVESTVGCSGHGFREMIHEALVPRI